METMFVEFTEKVGSWEPGHIESLKRSVAQGFIAAGQAKESDAMSHLQTSLKAADDKRWAALEERLAKVLRPQAPSPTYRPTPPSGGGGVDFNTLSSGTPAEEQDRKLCLADAMRCVFIAQATGAPPELSDYCRRRLRLYSDEFTEYQVDQNNGQLIEVTTRQLAGGGLETITRTGTESVGGGSQYGFTLKPNYIGNLFRIAREASVFDGATRPIPVSQGNEVIWPNLDQFKAPTVVNGIPQAAVFGGISLQYLGEIAPRVSTDAAVDQNRFKVFDLAAITDFARDYIVDNYIAMDSEVTRLFGEAIGWIRDWVYIRGDGIAKPQGYFNANAAITGGPSSNARYNANQISSDDLAWMLSHLATMCWMNSRWIANVTAFPQLYILRDHNGNAVFQPNALIDQAMLLSLMKGSTVDEAELVSRPMGVLLGRPIYFSEKVPTLGNTGDISLVAPYQYGDATKAGIEIGVSEHFFFSTDRIAYRAKMRHFGKSLWRAPYIQADNLTAPASGTQVSPFVLLHS